MHEQAVQDFNGRFKLATLSTREHLDAQMQRSVNFFYGYTFGNLPRHNDNILVEMNN